MFERDGKNREEDRSKRACLCCSLTTVDWQHVARTYLLRSFCLPMPCCHSLLFYILIFFPFVFFFSLNPRPFVQSFFDMYVPRQRRKLCSVCVTFSIFFGDITFLLDGVLFYPPSTGWMLTPPYVKFREMIQSVYPSPTCFMYVPRL